VGGGGGEEGIHSEIGNCVMILSIAEQQQHVFLVQKCGGVADHG